MKLRGNRRVGSSRLHLLKSGLRVTARYTGGVLREPYLGARSLRVADETLSRLKFENRMPISPLSARVLDAIFSSAYLAPPRSAFVLGNQEIQGLEALVGIGRLLDAKTVFEIGTYNGTTAWSLGANLPSATIHTLDLPVSARPALRFRDVEDVHRIDFQARTYDSLQGARNVHQHFGDSAQFDFSPWHAKCDLIYIDGAHSLEYVESDTRNALAMASRHSAIVWDDVWHREPEVLEALMKHPELELFRVPETRLVCHFPSGIQRV